MVANAGPPDGPALAGVSTANTKAIGYAPASRLSDGLSQIVLAHRHVSAGDPDIDGILGAKNPNLGDHKWRWFYTEQRGDNPTDEVLVG